MIAVVDVGLGNIGSVVKALMFLNADFKVVTESECLLDCTGIILPGVGNFSAASSQLFSSDMANSICYLVKEKKIPILGICIGMQLLASFGEEGGGAKGLNLIDGEVKKINGEDKDIKIPHMGWNSVSYCNSEIFKGIPPDSDFYFVHSYAMVLREDVLVATVDYAGGVTAFVNKDNIYGAQFHPEKSQSVGLKFIENFIALC